MPTDREQFEVLTAQVLERAASPEELARFRQLLNAHPEFVAIYRRQVLMATLIPGLPARDWKRGGAHPVFRWRRLPVWLRYAAAVTITLVGITCCTKMTMSVLIGRPASRTVGLSVAVTPPDGRPVMDQESVDVPLFPRRSVQQGTLVFLDAPGALTSGALHDAPARIPDVVLDHALADLQIPKKQEKQMKTTKKDAVDRSHEKKNPKDKWTTLRAGAASLALGASVAARVATPVSALAATSGTYVWEGDVSAAWSTAGNWTNNAGYPDRNYSVVFQDPADSTYQPNISGEYEYGLLTFTHAGWNLQVTGSGAYKGYATPATANISSYGVGTNRIAKLTKNTGTNLRVYTVGESNTLVIASGVTRLGTKAGPGTLDLWATTETFPYTIEGTFLFNSTCSIGYYNNYTCVVTNGAVLGGTGTWSSLNSAFCYIYTNAVLAPGACGLGDAVPGTLTFRQDSTVSGRDFNFRFLNGSSLAIDVWPDGASDQLHLDGESTTATGVDLFLTINSGVTLALNGKVSYNAIYTVVTLGGFALGNQSGSFDVVTLNGSVLTQDKDYDIVYAASAITLTTHIRPLGTVVSIQ